MVPAGEVTAMLDVAVNNSQFPVVVVGRETLLRFANRAACELLGYSRQELLRLTVADIHGSVSEAGWERCWSEARRSKTIVLEGCLPNPRRQDSGG